MYKNNNINTTIINHTTNNANTSSIHKHTWGPPSHWPNCLNMPATGWPGAGGRCASGPDLEPQAYNI